MERRSKHRWTNWQTETWCFLLLDIEFVIFLLVSPPFNVSIVDVMKHFLIYHHCFKINKLNK